jgi:hypothetical protein
MGYVVVWVCDFLVVWLFDLVRYRYLQYNARVREGMYVNFLTFRWNCGMSGDESKVYEGLYGE